MRSYLSLLLFLCTAAVASPILDLQLQISTTTEHAQKPELWSPVFWQKIGISMVLVLLGGLFAGLTLALMGLNELYLRVLATSSQNPSERSNASKVLALLEKGRHWVLVARILLAAIINESLPIFLDSAIGGGFAAVVLSAAAIAASVRYGLTIGSLCAPFVLILMYLLAPIAYPIAALLDRVLGAHGVHTYNKAELKTLLQFHTSSGRKEGPLRDDEMSILSGVLELGAKQVGEIMTPMRDVVTIAADALLDDELIEIMIRTGYSRFPVHEKGNPQVFVGLLLVKKLLRYDPALRLPVSHFPLSILPEAPPSIDCFQALDYFQTGRAHLLLVSRTPGMAGGALGVEILSEEIVDETDFYEDNVSKQQATRLMAKAGVMQGIVEKRRCATATERTCLIQFDSDAEAASVLGSGGNLGYGSIGVTR
ncbi:hemolysin [Roridomyces roridus]|uniref:Hemolysin n=1 Tax=Roridomyces roridus TaxID=1738132 RepID=A0AAD7FCX9_9AGAR|nr:hemolysin [Roridomyces roridus]